MVEIVLLIFYGGFYFYFFFLMVDGGLVWGVGELFPVGRKPSFSRFAKVTVNCSNIVIVKESMITERISESTFLLHLNFSHFWSINLCVSLFFIALA